MRLYSEAQMKDCWEAGAESILYQNRCNFSSGGYPGPKPPDRDQYLSTVKPVEVMKWVKASERLPQHYVKTPLKVLTEDGWQYHIGWWDFSRKGFMIYAASIPMPVDRVEWLDEPTLATDKK